MPAIRQSALVIGVSAATAGETNVAPAKWSAIIKARIFTHRLIATLIASACAKPNQPFIAHTEKRAWCTITLGYAC
jgi:hypothetical protein